MKFVRVVLAFCLVFAGLPSWAQVGGETSAAQAGEEGEEIPEVDYETLLSVETTSSPANPVAGGSWTLTVLTDHPVTREVTVRPPRFPQALVLERVRTELRYIRPPAREGSPDSAPRPEPSRWTAVEFLFSLTAAGSFSIEPFYVSAGIKQGSSSPFTLRVAAVPRTTRQAAPSLRWERIPSGMKVGAETELVLALHNWDQGKPVPRYLFRGNIPEHFILEELPVIESGSDRIIRYPLRIIPLTEETFVFGPLKIAVGDLSLEIPRVNIPVSADPASLSAPSALPPVSPAALALTITPEDAPGSAESDPPKEIGEDPFPFPRTSANSVFPLFRKGYETIIGQARNLWEEGSRANALALIRANERDRIYGAAFIAPRRDMEKLTALTFTEDEPRGFWYFFAVITASSLMFILGLALLVKNLIRQGKIRGQRAVTIHGTKGFKVVLAVLALNGAGIVLFCAGIVVRFAEPRLLDGCSALVRMTDAYRVPDTAGALVTLFNEGQPVIVRSVSPGWVFVETVDHRAGWVKVEAVIPY